MSKSDNVTERLCSDPEDGLGVVVPVGGAKDMSESRAAVVVEVGVKPL